MVLKLVANLLVALHSAAAAEALLMARAAGLDLGLVLDVLCRSAASSRMLEVRDRKSTRLNSSHGYISYAVFCLKKKKTTEYGRRAPTYGSAMICSGLSVT